MKRAAGLQPMISRRDSVLMMDFANGAGVAAVPPVFAEEGMQTASSATPAGAEARRARGRSRRTLHRCPTRRPRIPRPGAPPASIEILNEGGLMDGKEYVGPPHLARLQGGRHRGRAAPDRGGLRPQRDRRRRGEGQGDDPPGGRALGPGARRDPADQGPRLRAHRQRAADRRVRRARAGRGAPAPGAPRQGEARGPRRQAPAGQLRERRATCRRWSSSCSPSAARSTSTSAPTR